MAFRASPPHPPSPGVLPPRPPRVALSPDANEGAALRLLAEGPVASGAYATRHPGHGAFSARLQVPGGEHPLPVRRARRIARAPTGGLLRRVQR